MVPESGVEEVLSAMHNHPLGREGAVVGRVTDAHPGAVVGLTAIGGRRVIDLPAGELLPEIC